MPDYSLSKIYRLWIGDLVYIGSTSRPRLSMRLGQHKTNYKQWVKTGKQYMTSFELFKVGMPKIELIETYPCKSKDELHAREGHHQRNTLCVNLQIAGQTAAEYYLANKDKRNEYQRGYYEANQEKRNEYQKGYRLENQANISERMKGYYEANQEKRNEYQKGYYEANQPRICERKKEHYQANKTKLCEYQRLRRESMKRVECLTLFIHSHLRKVVV